MTMTASAPFDAAVTVQDGREGLVEIAVNRAVLTAASTYFAQRFPQTEGVVAVEGRDVAVDALRLVFTVCHDPQCIYSITKEPPKSQLVQAALELAVRLGFNPATRKHLLRIRILTAPERHQYTVYEKEWNKKGHPSSQVPQRWDIVGRRHFSVFYLSALSHTNLRYVLESPELIASDRDVLRVIIEWKKVHPNHGRKALDGLLEHARLDTLTEQEIRIMIINDAMPRGHDLMALQENSRRYLTFVHFEVKDKRGYDVVHKLKIPNFFAPLNSNHDAHNMNRTGVAWIQLPISYKMVQDWEAHARNCPDGQYPLILNRMSVTMGNFALSIWLFVNLGSLWITVVVDRRLSGDNNESLEDALSSYALQCFLSSKSRLVARGDLDTNVILPATDAARSKTVAQNIPDWAGAVSYPVIQCDQLRKLLHLESMKGNPNNTTLQTIVDVRLLRPRAMTA